jgi:sec-independent protein translocase protein TatA
MFGIGMTELLLILLLALLLFGGRKLPELAKGLGSGLREFKKAAKELDGDDGGVKAASKGEPPAAGGDKASGEEPS